VSPILHRLRQPGAIRIEFQPIVRVHADHLEIYAFEALARGPRGTSMERPAVMFEYARRKGTESEIDLICIAQALISSAALPGRPLISINVHGATLTSVPDFAERFLNSAEAYGHSPNRLMLEIVEYRAPWAIETFRATLDELRDAGVHIAVDDLGVGASNYQMIVDAHPDHLKIDRHLVHGCSRDPWRKAVLQSVVTLAHACAATPIAEGIEDLADLEVLLETGIDTVQGWLYAQSMPALELAAKSAQILSPPIPQRMKGSCT